MRPRGLTILLAVATCAKIVNAGFTANKSVMQFDSKHHQSSKYNDYRNEIAIISCDNLCNRGGAIQSVNNEEQYKISLSPLAFSSIFAFLGGWSHALCNRKFDVYTAMVSGHIINMSILLAEKQWKKALWRVSVIGSYFVGVASGRCIEIRCMENQDEKRKTLKHKDASPVTEHFKIIALLVVFVFSIAEKLEKIQVNLLAFGYGLIYPAVSATLGGTITHLLTGHTTNIARLVGARQTHHKGMKTSAVILGSLIAGAIFGINAFRVLGEEFPFFTMLGFIYAAALLLF